MGGGGSTAPYWVRICVRPGFGSRTGREVVLPMGDVRRAKLMLTDALIAATATPTLAN